MMSSGLELRPRSVATEWQPLERKVLLIASLGGSAGNMAALQSQGFYCCYRRHPYFERRSGP